MGITLTRTNHEDITAQQAAFPAAELDTCLPKLVRAGKRVAICDEPTKFTEPSAESESAPQVEQASEPSALGKAYEQMKAKHPDSILLFRCGDFYEAYGDDARTASEVLGITLTRTSRKDITAQMAGFPHHALDTYLPKLVRAGKRVAICDEPTKVAEKVEPAKKATRKSAKKEGK